MSNKKLTPEEVREKLQHARIEMATQDGIASLQPYVDRIMEGVRKIAGISGAFISDESCLTDFPFGDDDAVTLSEMLGVSIDLNDENDNYIVRLAYKMKLLGQS